MINNLDEAPKSGWLPEGKKGKFVNLPLSTYTLDGLKRGGFEFMTRIQEASILHALAGRDILAAAKTGSGKTLSFLIPLFEKMFLSKWTNELGIGAIIITPTRELALQIYEVIKVVACEHQVVVGLFIGSGGKTRMNSFKTEQKRAPFVNVVVCTPGRFLQHLEQTPDLSTDDTSLLILDEADRLLDMGFLPQLTRILNYLPKPQPYDNEAKFDPLRRQTLLFSATQTKSVEKLANLSLIDPEVIAVHEQDESATPKKLSQIYSVVELDSKLRVLYSFLRSHLKSKIIVFFSSCKQVQFVDAAFRRLQPGLRLMALHGKMKQMKRMDVYYEYIDHDQRDNTHQREQNHHQQHNRNDRRKQKTGSGACLFATDIVARGLDFPNVDWVVQVDCPESVDMYIHRVGRTARYRFNGKALLLLTPKEAEPFVSALTSAKIPIFKKDINEARVEISAKGMDLTKKLASEVAKDVELKEIAQKAFKSYVRSIHLQPNKNVFDARSLPLAAFARSLGLSSTPRVRISGLGGINERVKLRKTKNQVRIPNEVETTEVKENKTKWERLMNRKQKLRSEIEVTNGFNVAEDDDSDDESILNLKQTLKPIENDLTEQDTLFYQSQKARKKLKIGKDGVRKGKVRGTRTVFNEEGKAVSEFELLVQQKKEEKIPFLDKVNKKLEENADLDKLDEKNRIRAKHKKERLKSKDKKLEVQSDSQSDSDDDESKSSFLEEENEKKSEENVDLEAEALKIIGL